MIVLFVTWNGGGNVRPVLATAADLGRRGHECHVLTNPSLERRVEATGARFHAFQRLPPHDPARPETDIVRAWEGNSIGEINRIIGDRLVIGPAGDFFADTWACIDRLRPHVVVADYVLVGAMFAAEAASIPVVTTQDGMYPLPYPDRPRTASTYAYLFERMIQAGLPSLNALRRRAHLSELARPDQIYDAVARFLVMSWPVMSPAATPARCIYVGPQFAPTRSPACVAAGEDAPLVLGSFSTIYTLEQDGFVERLGAVLGRMAVKWVVGTGSSKPWASVAPNGQALPFIPLEELLPRAAVLVSHAGNGTIVRALAQGIPQLCVPFIQDQHDYAKRIESLGVGLVLSRNAPEQECHSALLRLLTESVFRQRAREVADGILREYDESLAARCIESVAGASVEHSKTGS